MIDRGKRYQKIENKIDKTYEKYKLFKYIFLAAGITSFPLFPYLSLPFLFLANRYSIKEKKFSPKNIDKYGDPLYPLGYNEIPYKSTWGGGDFVTGKGASGIFFGIDEYDLPIHINDKNGILTHGIIFGATGAGKTTAIFNIMRQQVQRGGGFIFIDGKSENPTWTNVYEICLESGREDEVFLLSFRASVLSSTNTWSILMSGSSTQIGEMLSELALPADAGQNQIFVERGKQLMFAVLSAMTYLRDVKKEVVTIADIINMLKPDALLAMLRPTKEDALNDEKTRPYARYWIPEDYVEEGMSLPAKQMLRNFAETIGASHDGYVGQNQDKLYRDQHSYAAMQFNPALADLANTYGKIFNAEISDINIEDLVRNNRILYVLLPSLEKSTKSLEGIGKLVLSAVKQAAAAMLGGLTEGDKDAQMLKENRKKRAKPPFIVIPDEYGSYAIKGFSDVLAQARSLGIGVIISIQEKASLVKAGKEEAERILGNTRFKIGLNVEDLETKKYLSEQAGKTWAYVKNSAVNKKFNPFDSELETEENLSLQQVPVITPEEFGQFASGEGVFLFFSKLRKFKTPYYEPKKSNKILLNKLYPNVRIELPEKEELGEI